MLIIKNFQLGFAGSGNTKFEFLLVDIGQPRRNCDSEIHNNIDLEKAIDTTWFSRTRIYRRVKQKHFSSYVFVADEGLVMR